MTFRRFCIILLVALAIYYFVNILLDLFKNSTVPAQNSDETEIDLQQEEPVRVTLEDATTENHNRYMPSFSEEETLQDQAAFEALGVNYKIEDE